MEGDHKSSLSDPHTVNEDQEHKKSDLNVMKMTLLASYKDDNGRTHSKELTALPNTTLSDIIESLKETPEGNININSITIKIV